MFQFASVLIFFSVHNLVYTNIGLMKVIENFYFGIFHYEGKF